MKLLTLLGVLAFTDCVDKIPVFVRGDTVCTKEEKVMIWHVYCTPKYCEYDVKSPSKGVDTLKDNEVFKCTKNL